jgi:dephospho-CoA kinase
MKLIGLTGGIGAGKSTVSDYLKEKGYPILDADQTAKDLLRPGTETLGELIEVFGNDILFPDGSLDRNHLAKIVFSDPKKKAELDRITHAKVIEVILQEAAKFPDDAIVFIDAPLFFEAGMDRFVAESWVVDAGDEMRIGRVMKRDTLTRDDIKKRIRNQMDRRERLKRSDYVLDNSGSKENLYMQVNKLLEHLQG